MFMKRILFVIAFFGMFGFASVNAQSCSKSAAGASCCSKKSASTTMANPEKMSKAASMDKSIVATTNPDGSVSYARKTVDAASGKEIISNVIYDQATESFITEKHHADGKACVGEMKDGACCAKKATGTSSAAPVKIQPGSKASSTM